MQTPKCNKREPPGKRATRKEDNKWPPPLSDLFYFARVPLHLIFISSLGVYSFFILIKGRPGASMHINKKLATFTWNHHQTSTRPPLSDLFYFAGVVHQREEVLMSILFYFLSSIASSAERVTCLVDPLLSSAASFVGVLS